MGKIKELNQKVWYRILKVIYIFCFLIAFGVTFLHIFYIYSSSISNTDNTKTVIKCLYGNKKEFHPADYNLDFSKALNDDFCLDIEGDCTISPEERYKDDISRICEIDKNNKNQNLFNVNKVYKDISGILILSLSGVVLVFEIIKRVFLLYCYWHNDR